MSMGTDQGRKAWAGSTRAIGPQALLAGLLLLSASSAALGAVWDGGGIGTLWTTKENWTTDTAPVAGDALQFPAGALQMTNFNTFPNLTAFASLAIQASGYQLQGQSISNGGGIVYSAASGSSDLFISQKLTADQTF